MARCCMCNTKIGEPSSYLIKDKPVCEKCAKQIRILEKSDDSEKCLQAYQYIRELANEVDDTNVEEALATILEENNNMIISNEGTEEGHESVLFDNIERKIMGLAKVTFWLGTIASILCAVCFLLSESWLGSRHGELILVGVAFLIFGPLLSWVESFAIYGFGKLIENSKIQKEAMLEIRDALCGSEKQSRH